MTRIPVLGRAAWAMAAFIVLAMAGCASHRGGGLYPSAAEFHSERVAIVVGGMMGSPGGGVPEIRLVLKNTTTTPLWVKTRFETPDPHPDCEALQAIVPDASATYVCRQDGIVADADYPLTVSVFQDAGHTEALEARTVAMRFKKRDIRTFMAFIAPVTLPAHFKKLVHVEKFGLKTAVLGDLALSSGTLEVRADGITYASPQQTIEIPMSAVQKVFRKQLKPPPSPAWVVVQYTWNGRPMLLGLAPGLFGKIKSLNEAYRVLMYAHNAYVADHP